MSHYNKKITGTEVAIYMSIWKSLIVGMGSLILAARGVYWVSAVSGNDDIAIIMGWAGILFFGAGGLLYILATLYMNIFRIPYFIIYTDRLEYYMPTKRKYHTIYFKDVERFHLMKLSYSIQVAVDYKPAFIKNTFDSENTSFVKKHLMSFQYKHIETIQAFPTVHLDMKGKEICDILNEHLRLFVENKPERAGVLSVSTGMGNP